MLGELEQLATSFIDIAMKYDDWKEMETLPENEVQVLFDVALRLVRHKEYTEDKWALVSVCEAIQDSRPLEPIQLTPEGDFLREYPPREKFGGYEYFIKHTRDDRNLDTCVGIHKYCHGWIEYVRLKRITHYYAGHVL